MASIDAFIDFRLVADELVAVQEAFERLAYAMLGPKATPRKRPRRRIAQRDGRLRFKSAVMRECTRGGK